MLIRIVRSALRLVAFVFVAGGWILRFIPGGYGRSYRGRTEWSIGCARAFLRLFGFEWTVEGAHPGRGIVVANHLGYMDIVVFAASGPTVFVSKSEVGGWPGIGTLARLSGTIFLNRARKSDLARAAEKMGEVIAEGVPVLFFPEGTSTGGDRILPFHAGLFEPAAAHGWTVTPAWIGYELEDGVVSEEVCYWRDMTFLPHFLNLLKHRRVRARIRFGQPLAPEPDRKALAAAAHAAVTRLSEGR